MALSNSDKQWAHRQRQRQRNENVKKVAVRVDKARQAVYEWRCGWNDKEPGEVLYDVDELLNQIQLLLLDKEIAE
jgi:hypothetical protein